MIPLFILTAGEKNKYRVYMPEYNVYDIFRVRFKEYEKELLRRYLGLVSREDFQNI